MVLFCREFFSSFWFGDDFVDLGVCRIVCLEGLAYRFVLIFSFMGSGSLVLFGWRIGRGRWFG